MYMAWLCFSHTHNDQGKIEGKIEFEEPNSWKYNKVIPIQFSVLHSWTDKDKDIYNEI